ncbi:MAG: acyl-CoA dehydrogenase family protein [bacterium]
MFNQEPPELSNPYESDGLLQAYLDRKMGSDRRKMMDSKLTELGDLTSGKLFNCQLETLDEEPELIRVSPWGERVDRIKHTELWSLGREVAVDYDLVSLPYNQSNTPTDRIDQFARVFLYAPSSDTFTCPLAMTDGAANVLLESGNQDLIDEAVPRLTSNDLDEFWTSGQWMTETSGGSDVSRSNTVARKNDYGDWELYGRKWFTSAIGSDMALTLAKTENGDEDSLTLFYVRTRGPEGKPRDFKITRLKDKLGTRELPTGEISLEGTPARPVMGIGNGVKNIFPMLNITRTWNAVCAAASMRRGLDLARSYAKKRELFGGTLSEKPLHKRVMNRLEAEAQGAFLLSFKAAELLGSDDDELARLLIPLAKLYTARQAVSASTEIIEVFGGAGYVEDTGLPKMLRDAHVLPIWEGTTSVLSLEVLRQLANDETRDRLQTEIQKTTASSDLSQTGGVLESVSESVDEIFEWSMEHLDEPEVLEANARTISFRLGRLIEVALLARQRDWNAKNDRETGSLEAARILLDSTDSMRNQLGAPITL